ncbi:MAG TPA: glycosyltransferase [Candidatus Angelobacter sp.]|nr:glycosyltransferase [Candidatus Angelobacter sp.]
MVTPVSPVATPTLYRLGMPLVLGPWNGGLKSPTTFPEFMSQDSAWMYPLRNFGKLFDLFNRALSAASIILTATDSTDRSIPSRYRPKCVRMLENGVDLSLFQAEVWPEPPTSTNPLRILFVGRLIPMKGVPMLIEAMSQITNSLPVELTIIGDGPERELLERQAAESGVSSRVRFVGAQSLTQVSSAMRQAHVFCLPSVRESGGAVLLEAMAAARPVIAVKYGGPAEVVNDEVGYAIEPVGREYVVKELVRTLRDVAARPDIWKKKGIAGRVRAEREFDWDAKVETALNLYRKVLGTNGSATSHDSGPADADVAGAEAIREALITHS